jgi:nitrite reductase/ring-hydroxylating ferredoxin subunit
MPDGRMEDLIQGKTRALCRLDHIPDNGAKGFPGAEGRFTGLVAIRQGAAVYVYENSCPHIGTPLDWTPDRFLSADGQFIICATHGAEFTISSGTCISGPCKGDRLTSVNVEIRNGVIHVPAGV